MPELILRDAIIDKLKEVDYNPEALLRKKSAYFLLRNYVTNLDDDITILDNDIFEVTINSSDYSEIIYTETFYEMNRITRQADAIKALIEHPTAPRAWIIVSAYYHSFFCANLITRLLGRYSCYFNAKEIRGIKTYAANSSLFDLKSGNYVGSFISYSDLGIKIRFRHEGERPHFTAWKNLHDKIGSTSANGINSERFNRIRLFKQIIRESDDKWPLPSETRNRWNYTDVFLYTKKGDVIAKEFCSLIGGAGDLQWASRNNLYPDEKNIATSVIFISSSLKRCLDSCQPKILRKA